MVRTRVGYAGGSLAQPTYRHLGDHSEALEIDYDPQWLTYADLLKVFWQAHDATEPVGSRQYASAIFPRSHEERRLAQESREAVARAARRPVWTEVREDASFWPAEDYHQKYYLRGYPPLARDLLARYPNPTDFRESTAAARLNAYVGGYGSLEQLRRDIGLLGLSPAMQEHLLALVGRRREW